MKSFRLQKPKFHIKRAGKFCFVVLLVLLTASFLGCAPAPAEEQVALDISPFIQLTENASCADLRNQLYVIDDQYVFWISEGQCEDAGYAYTLFGSTPDEKLCYLEDSFVGPRSACEPGLEELFETILQNLDQPDLGLGNEYVVMEVRLDQE